MCLVVFEYRKEPKAQFTLVANRDEFFKRETAKMNYWDEIPGLIAGKDLKAGGTWMGIHGSGDIAFLTNYRDPKYFQERELSRGKLITDFFERKDLESFINEIRKDKEGYNGYNLVFGNLKEGLSYYSNVNDEYKQIDSGVFGLSNAFLNTPWPKVEKSKSRFIDKLKGESSYDEYLNILRDNEEANESDLPSTGIPLEMEKQLSSPFIRMKEYGTRCSTFIKWDGNKADIVERSFQENPEDYYESSFEILIA